VYLALFTAMPTVAGGGTEVAGGSYARVAITNDAAEWPNMVAGVKANAIAKTFAEASANWGNIVGVGLFDALAVGNLQDFAPLQTVKTINNGDQLSFSIGALQFTET
jgi:hypothetical protein